MGDTINNTLKMVIEGSGVSKTVANPGTVTTVLGSVTVLDGNPFGSAYVNNGSITVTIVAPDIQYQIASGLSAGLCGGSVTFQNNRELKVPVAGNYAFFYSISMRTANANKEIESAVMVNGAAQLNGSAQSETSIGGANRPTTVSGCGVLALNANDLVSLAVGNHTDTNTVTVEHLSLLIVKISDLA